MLMIAIVQTVSACDALVRSPDIASRTTAISGRNRRLISLTTPYRAIPVVAGALGIPQPRITTQTTPMFQGPNGTLAPIPARISQDIVPRMTDRPATSAENTRPLRTQAMIPSTVMIRNCWSGQVLERLGDGRVVDVLRQDDDEDEDEDRDDQAGPHQRRPAAGGCRGGRGIRAALGVRSGRGVLAHRSCPRRITRRG